MHSDTLVAILYQSCVVKIWKKLVAVRCTCRNIALTWKLKWHFCLNFHIFFTRVFLKLVLFGTYYSFKSMAMPAAKVAGFGQPPENTMVDDALFMAVITAVITINMPCAASQKSKIHSQRSLVPLGGRSFLCSVSQYELDSLSWFCWRLFLVSGSKILMEICILYFMG